MPGPEDEAARRSAFEEQTQDAARRAALENESRDPDEVAVEGFRKKRKNNEKDPDYTPPTEGFRDYRPLEAMSTVDYLVLNPKECELVKDALKESILTPFLTFSAEIDNVVKATSAKKYLYSGQSALERSMYSTAQTEAQISTAESKNNETILGAVHIEMKRQESVLTIFNHSLPYMATYWGGMETMRLLSERGMQLPMADLARFYKGVRAKWVSDELSKRKYTPDVIKAIPLTKVEVGSETITVNKVKEDGSSDVDEAGNPLTVEQKFETATITETFGDRLAKYTGHADFWTRARGEMNVYNPLLGGTEKETLNLSKTMQDFVALFSKSQLRTYEDRTKEIAVPQRKITAYFDADGNQLPMEAFDSEGTRISKPEDVDRLEKAGNILTFKLKAGLTAVNSTEFYIETLDYFNKAKSELDRKWIVATTAAMCIENAKDILDSLPHDISTNASNPEAKAKYDKLVSDVMAQAQNIMDNFDTFNQDLMEQKLATTAFNLAYAMSFGNLSVGDIGWSYEWKYVYNEAKGGFVWAAEGAQGDPTASGDAFSARRPYFHELVYAGIKNRVSSFNSGAMIPVNGENAQELANALLSEAEELNQRGKMVEKLKKGEQPHLARFFGVIGAYQNELGSVGAWAEGAAIRANVKKEANPNLIQAVETSVMYIPTPFKDASGNYLYYPMLMPQFQISLQDMLSVSKDVSVGDVLRKTWKTDESGKLIEATPEDGGKRLTQQDVDWEQFGAYAEDSHAVNDNFMTQIYGPLYGKIDSKNLETLVSNPMAGLTGIIKAVDISTRNFVKKLKDGSKVKRPSYEIMYASSIMFQNLALGVHSLIGRGAVERYKDFIKPITPGDLKNRTPHNLYSVLRSVEDFLRSKQGYDNYEGSFYLMMLAQAEAIESIVVASDTMAHATTERMNSADTTGIVGWNGVYDKNKGL